MSKQKKKKDRESSPDTQRAVKKSAAPPMNGRLLLILILAATFISFFPVLRNEFLNFDDPQYVTENPVVQKLSGENVKQFFTEPFVGNYQPIVMLSYAIQFKLFGMHPGGFHFFSLLMHLLNTALVFFLCERLLKNTIAAAVTALLFGIHPLHVESVAWIASQKDVLYTFFFLAASVLYLKYTVNTANRKLYLFSMLCFVLSILSKAQAVVLPIIFLLFDFLLKRNQSKSEETLDGEGKTRKIPWSKLVMEKLPFFLLSLIFGALAIYYQKKAGAVQDFGYFKPHERVLFASYGFVAYLIQTVAPIQLGIFYAYPETLGKIDNNLVYLAPLVILALGAVVFYFRKRSPVLVFGSLFFCVTIALVIQIIPVGDALHADRYTYISLIGIFIFAGHLFAKYYADSARRNIVLGIGGAVMLLFGGLSFARAKVFHDNISVYSNSLENHPAAIIYSNLGAEYYKMAQNEKDAAKQKTLYEEALKNIAAASDLKPRFPRVWFYRGLADAQLGRVDDAIRDYSEAITHAAPDDFDSYMQRGSCYLAKQDFDKAIADFNQVIRINPGVINAYYTRAEIYGRKSALVAGDQKAACLKASLDDYNKVISMKPDFADAYINRAIANSLAGNTVGALADFNKALQMNPNAWSVYFNRSFMLKGIGRYAEALQDAETAKAHGYQVDEKYLTELRSLAGK